MNINFDFLDTEELNNMFRNYRGSDVDTCLIYREKIKNYIEERILSQIEQQKGNEMKKRKIIARNNLPTNFVLFAFQCAVVWLLLDRFNIAKTNQIWIGSILMIFLILLIFAKFKEDAVDIFKKEKN